MNVAVIDSDLVATLAQPLGEQLDQAGRAVAAAGTPDRDPPVACVTEQLDVVDQVVQQVLRARRALDDTLNARIAAVEAEDLLGGGRVAQSPTNVVDPVSQGRTAGQMEVTE